jgi:hypothetical protein
METTTLICVFCETLYNGDVVVCEECNDYKGLEPISSPLGHTILITKLTRRKFYEMPDNR